MKIQTLKSIFSANLGQLYKTDHNVVTSANSIVENFSKVANSQGIKTAIRIHKEAERHVKMSFLSQPSKFNHCQ